MIGFLKGIVFAFGLDWLLLDVNGVGYRLYFYHPESLKIGAELLIYTHQHVREDEISLYGFLSEAEYDLFLKLLSVKGIGPKIACGILARAEVEAIYQAIENGDTKFMKSMPGVGAKAASQIILDLKGKLISVDNNKGSKTSKLSLAQQEVKEALKSLGYKSSEIDAIVNKLEGEDTEKLLRQALGMLVR